MRSRSFRAGSDGPDGAVLARHKLARRLAHEFKQTGVAVCTDTLSVIAWVNPRAQIKFATPPFQRVERHQCVNNPCGATASAGGGSIPRAADRGA
jgi:hypothetical protein